MFCNHINSIECDNCRARRRWQAELERARREVDVPFWPYTNPNPFGVPSYPPPAPHPPPQPLTSNEISELREMLERVLARLPPKE